MNTFEKNAVTVDNIIKTESSLNMNDIDMCIYDHRSLTK